MKHNVAAHPCIHALSGHWIGWRLLILLSCIYAPLHAQEKGQSGLILDQWHHAGGITRAVVVGISDYQHPGIPDLRFAHRDAEAFASYLDQSLPRTDSISNIDIFLNETATSASIYGSLQTLEDESQKGDRVILYFSGHGDMESLESAKSYLLCYDAAYNNYAIGGTLEFGQLQSWAERLVANGVTLLLFMDACHAGNLAGESINGAGRTAQIFRDSFASATKYLACSPQESSFESDAWGNGHGVYTYFLIQGLAGMADQDHNSSVSYWELQEFLESKVVQETGFLQHPVGPMQNLEETLTHVDSALLKHVQTAIEHEFKVIPSLVVRSFENQLLTALDTSIFSDWDRFKNAISAGRLLHPEHDCAEFYYHKLINRPDLSAAFRRYISRTFVAGLLNDGQQAMKAILAADTKTISGGKELILSYAHYPAHFQKAAEILGVHHDMHSTVKSRAFLFEGILAYMKNASRVDSTSISQVMTPLLNSLQLEPNSAVTCFYISLCQMVQAKNPEVALNYTYQAHHLAPSWLVPLTHMAYYMARAKDRRLEDSKALLDRAFNIDENDPTAWLALGALYHYLPHTPKSIEAFQKVLSIDSTYAIAWTNLGVEYIILEDYDQAEKAFTKALRENPNQSAAWHSLGCLSTRKQDLDSAEIFYQKAVSLSPEMIVAKDSLCSTYLDQHAIDKAYHECQSIIQIKDQYASAHFKLAKIAALRNNRDTALDHLQKCLESDPGFIDDIRKNVTLYQIYSNRE